jgi:16S rRNA (guanine1207-N2)-methyltransferase
MHDDAALETLFLPLESGALSWPRERDLLFLRARDGWPLQRQPRARIRCTQPFRPEALALERSGLRMIDEESDSAHYPLVLLLPPRQRDEARALFARALDRLTPDGVLVASMPNDEGAKSGESDLAQLAGPLGVTSKNKCRVFWTRPGPAIDADRLAAWRELDAPRTILDGRFRSRPGVFAWNRVDAASQLLASSLPNTLGGDGADLGAGWGFLSTEVLARNPGVRSLDLFEADARALALARENLQPWAARVALGFHWHDVTTGLPRRYDFIVSNPPFHALGNDDRPDIGRAFIAAAADALKPKGRLWMVANRHLPYETVLDARFDVVRTVQQRDGFKVIEAIRSAGGMSR